jgi:hypothetical protein
MRHSRAAAAALAMGTLLPLVGSASAASGAAARPAVAAAPAAARTTTSALFFGTHNWGPWDLAAEQMRTGTSRNGGTEWYQVERSRGRFSWRAVDDELALAAHHGHQQVLFVLGGTPSWAAGPNRSSDPASPRKANPPRNVADWDRYVTAVATHLKGRNVALQVWNEANLTTFYNGTPALMATMTAHAYRIVKRIAPSIPVVAASTTLRLTPDYERFFPVYLRRLAALGWPVDAFSIHTYPPSTGTPATSRGYIVRAKATLSAAGAPSRPLWITEVNFGLAGPGPRYPKRTITGGTAAAWIARTYLDARWLGVSRVYWYTQAQYDVVVGIKTWSGTPAMRAERTLASWMIGAAWLGCRTSRPMITCSVSRGTRVWRISWSEGGTRTIRVPRGATRFCTVLNVCRTVRAGTSVRITGMVTRLGPA